MKKRRKVKLMKKSRKSEDANANILSQCAMCKGWVWQQQKQRLATKTATTTHTLTCYPSVSSRCTHCWVSCCASYWSCASCRQWCSWRCDRPLNLYPKFLHISHRENGSFDVLCLHTTRAHFFCGHFAHVHACHTRMAQGHEKKCLTHVVSLHLAVSVLMFHTRLRLLFLHGHFETNLTDAPVRTVLPNFPDPKARVKRTSARATSSFGHLAKSVLHTSYEPKGARQDHFCGRWHAAHQRSEPQHLWLLENTTRVHWTIRCFHSVWILCFARFSWWFCSLREKAKKICNCETVARQRERKEKVLCSMLLSRCQGKVNGTASGVILFRLTKNYILMIEISEDTLNEELTKLFLTKIQVRENHTRLGTIWRPKILERRNSEYTSFESQRELETQRLQLLEPIQWADQAQWEKYICATNWKWRIVFTSNATQETAKNLKNSKRRCCQEENIEKQRRLEYFPMQHDQEITYSESIERSSTKTTRTIGVYWRLENLLWSWLTEQSWQYPRSSSSYTKGYEYSWTRSWWITQWFKKFCDSENRRNWEKWERRKHYNQYLYFAFRKEQKQMSRRWKVSYVYDSMPCKAWQFRIVSPRRCICKNSLTKRNFRAGSWISEQKFAKKRRISRSYCSGSTKSKQPARWRTSSIRNHLRVKNFPDCEELDLMMVTELKRCYDKYICTSKGGSASKSKWLERTTDFSEGVRLLIWSAKLTWRGKGQNSYAERKTGECFQRKTVGSCSRRDNCNFLHTHEGNLTQNEHPFEYRKWKNRLTWKAQTVSRPVLRLVLKIPCLWKARWKASSRVSWLQVWKQMHLWHSLPISTCRWWEVTPARSREKKVFKEQLPFWGEKESKVVYLGTHSDTMNSTLRKPRELGLNASAGHTMKFLDAVGAKQNSVKKRDEHLRKPHEKKIVTAKQRGIWPEKMHNAEQGDFEFRQK